MIRWGAATDVGLVRERNEDSYLAEPPIFAVADGMGGHLAGDVASQTAIKAIISRAAENPDDLRDLLVHANEAIWQISQEDSETRGMGTTTTLVYLDGHRARLVHVGDSRAYLCREGQLTQLTDDHTLVGRMLREGKLTVDEAEHHPQRNIVTRALGVQGEVEVDEMTIELVEGDRVVICSDGLNSMVGAGDIAAVLADKADPQQAAEGLIEIAKRAGGEDNITVIVIDVIEGEPTEAERALTTRPEEPRSERPEPIAVEAAPRRRLLRPLAITATVLVVLVVGGVSAARYALSNSWFVGINDDDEVAIFSGIPDEVAGIDLRDEEEATGIDAELVPGFKRADLEEGISADSLDDARTIVESIEDLLKDPDAQPSNEQPSDEETRPTRKPSP